MFHKLATWLYRSRLISIRLKVVKWLAARTADNASAPILIDALRDEDASIRRIAVRALGQTKDPTADAHLLSALNDAETCFEAARALAVRNHAAGLSFLLLGLKRGETRDNAEMMLSQCGPIVIPSVVEALRSGGLPKRRAALRALRALGWTPKDLEEELTALVVDARWSEVIGKGRRGIERVLTDLQWLPMEECKLICNLLKPLATDLIGHLGELVANLELYRPAEKCRAIVDLLLHSNTKDAFEHIRAALRDSESPIVEYVLRLTSPQEIDIAKRILNGDGISNLLQAVKNRLNRRDVMQLIGLLQLDIPSTEDNPHLLIMNQDWERLGRMGGLAIPPLLEAICDADVEFLSEIEGATALLHRLLADRAVQVPPSHLSLLASLKDPVISKTYLAGSDYSWDCGTLEKGTIRTIDCSAIRKRAEELVTQSTFRSPGKGLPKA